MTTKAAKESELAGLHSKVARVMSNALSNLETAQELYDSTALDQEEYKEPPVVSAPLLGVITKFLSDNKISCVPEDSAELTDLEKRLKEKRHKRMQVGNVVHLVQDE